MLLFRFAKMMEEHSKLKHTIQDAEGDVGDLLQRKEQMEEELMAFNATVSPGREWESLV